MGKLSIAIFYFLLSLRMICYSQEIYDIETLPSFRTQQYVINPAKRIVIFSAPRTGSMLTYNIFKFLFEDDSKLLSHHDDFDLDRRVLRTHKFEELDLVKNDEDTVCIFTLRNPLDAAVSNYRICVRKILDRKHFAKKLADRHYTYLLHSNLIEKNGVKVLRIKYEDFANDMDYIFKIIENTFLISIDPNDIDLMRKGYSKENINLCTKHLASFKEYLPISGFHGKHVILNDYEPPPDFLFWLNFYLEKLKPLFRSYGYFEDELLDN